MALIKCPECGKEVSDKAPACIHCGYPLSIKYTNNSNEYDLNNELHMSLNGQKIDAIKSIRVKTGLGLANAKELEEYMEANECVPPQEIIDKMTKEEKSKISKLPKCPICGSTNLSKISIIKTGMKIGAFGLLGAGDVGKTWKCNNCGSKF